jgi:F420H(2)-dependent quinone reductase
MMESLEEVLDSPTGWVARHVHRYVETDGRRGHKWFGMDTLLLITRGRRSGKLRPTAVIYGRDGGRYVLGDPTAERRSTLRGTSTWASTPKSGVGQRG